MSVKKYDVILADPPWSFSAYNPQKSSRHVSHKYDLMSAEGIASLPICSVSRDNCALFMWATWPNLEQAIDVIKAWGFVYRTLAWIWVKANKGGMGFKMGLGYYTRSNSEPCLLAVRGRMPVHDHGVMSVIYSPVREHSRKPDEQYGKIDRLYPGTNRLELFARRKRPGWDVFGNQVDDSISLEVNR